MEIRRAAAAAANVRAELARRALTQQDLAAQIGRSQAWVSRRLAGSVPMTLDDLEAMSGALGVSIDQLLAVAA